MALKQEHRSAESVSLRSRQMDAFVSGLAPYAAMKILLASNYMPPHLGGIEYAAESLKRCWEKRGHLVTWIATNVDQADKKSSGGHMKVPACNFLEDMFEINAPIFSPTVLPCLSRLAREHDVVNTHSLVPGLSLAVLHAALRQRRPAVVTQHVGIIDLKSRMGTYAQNLIMPWLARRALSRGALMSFVSPAVRDWFKEVTGAPPDRFRITPAGINREDYYLVTDAERTALREKWNLPRDRAAILFVGRFVEKKGVPLLREIAGDCNDARFTFLGSGPIDVAGWNLPNLAILKHVSTAELRELYGAHDLLIMPSYGEGWPAVIPQAMSCGTPCLLSREAFSGHNRDERFFVVRERTREAFTRVVREVVKGRIPLDVSRSELSDYAGSQWDWMTTADIYLRIFEELLAPK